jgi:hypothetical protein
LTNDCKIKNAFYIQNKKFIFKSLTGKQREKIFANINLKNLFPNDESMKKRQEIIQSFYKIYCGIRDNLLQADEIKTKTTAFTDNYIKLYGSNLTPYMHCFVSHLHEFREIHGDFNIYNQQGLEKLNDRTTTDYFRSTNRTWFNVNVYSSNFLVQIMNKRNRTEICCL